MATYKRVFKVEAAKKSKHGEALRRAHAKLGWRKLKDRFESIRCQEVWTDERKMDKCHLPVEVKATGVKRYATRPDGYVQLSAGSWDGKQENVYHCDFALYYKYGLEGKPEQGIPRDERWSCSHLCHHPDCGNPNHVVLEDLWKNVRRQSCSGPDSCECDPVHKCIAKPVSYVEEEEE